MPKARARIGSVTVVSLICIGPLLGLEREARAYDTLLDAPPVEKVIERGAHYNVVEISRAVLDKNGQLTIHKGQYTALQNGMNRLVNGEWVESRAVVEGYPTGAIANQGPHQVIFSKNLLAEGGTIDLLTPDGKRLRAVPVGLGWKNAKTGQFAWIARAQDTVGVIQPPNVVVYENAFDSIKANLVVTYTTAGIEVWVVLKENPILPNGFEAESSLFQVITEFLEVPTAVSEKILTRHTPPAAVAENWVEPELTDIFTDWGAMQLWPGRAFPLVESGATNNLSEARVFKHWQNVDNRSLLFETLPYPAIRSELEKLPQQTAQAKPVVRERFKLAALPASAKSEGTMRVASAKLSESGFVVDWTVVYSQFNYTFCNGITYKIQSAVSISQSAQIQSGAILKYTTSAFGGTDGSLGVAGSITGPEPYQPCAYFTHIADNTIGEPVFPGTIGDDKYPCALYVSSLSSTSSLRRLEIRYAQKGVWGSYLATTGLSVEDSIFKHCDNGIVALYSAIWVRRTLMCDVDSPLYAMTGGSFPESDYSTDCETAPSITVSPSDAERDVNGQVTFSVTATGYALNYQWYFNNASIAGATAPTLTIQSLKHTNAGKYFVVVANENGFVRSDTATLTVKGYPFLTVQPRSQTLPQGSYVVFTVEAIGGPPYSENSPFYYKWYRYPGILVQEGASHEFAGFNLDAGQYFVAVFNGYGPGSVTSTNATLAYGDNQDRCYDSSADFDQGILINLNHNVAGQLQINIDPAPLPYVNVPCSGRGSLARINVNSGTVVGEFYTAPTPHSYGPDPSRTAVDRFGNVWVANRQDDLTVPNEKGSITKIGMVIGGIRCVRLGSFPYYYFVANPEGEWLRPPFIYNTCPDKDGDGAIHTSHGLGNRLSWPANGQSTGDDEAILKYVWVDATYTRALAIDQTNNVWVGGSGVHFYTPEHMMQVVDGETGTILWTTNPELTSGGYGAVFTVDDAGYRWLWSSFPKTVEPEISLVRIRNDSNKIVVYGDSDWDSYANYGLAVDPQTRAIWATGGTGEGYQVARIPVLINDPRNGVETFLGHSPVHVHQGLVVDNHNNVWIAHGRSIDIPPNPAANTIGHLRADSQTDVWIGNVTLSSSDNIRPGPTGVSIDSNQKVWVANRDGSSAMRVDPNAGPYAGENNQYRIGQVDLTVDLEAGASPYAYSDMTGFVTLGTTYPSGSWIFVQDGGTNNWNWYKISWNGSTPAGTGITVEVRAANSITGLPGSGGNLNSFRNAANNQPLTNPSVTGRYLEVRVTLWRDPGTANRPILYDLTVHPTN